MTGSASGAPAPGAERRRGRHLGALAEMLALWVPWMTVMSIMRGMAIGGR